MNWYIVRWEIHVAAESAVDAAIEVAIDYFQPRIQHGRPDTACVFQVEEDREPHGSEMIDLSKLGGALTALRLQKMFGKFEHPEYQQFLWRAAIDREETLLGYWDWVANELK